MACAPILSDPEESSAFPHCAFSSHPQGCAYFFFYWSTDIYNIVLVSGVEQSNYTYIYILFR